MPRSAATEPAGKEKAVSDGGRAAPEGAAAGSGNGRSPGGSGTGLSLREVLAGYDDEVQRALGGAVGAESGLAVVRALHNRLRPAVVVHDAVLSGSLCPLLEQVPGTSGLVGRLRKGCEERAELLARFERVSHHVAAHNVYPVSGSEVEHVLDGLGQSFAAHVREETVEVDEVLASAAAAGTSEGIALSLAFEARRAPTRHSSVGHESRSKAVRAFRRWQDRFDDWSDTHWNWSDPDTERSPRTELVRALFDQASEPEPSVRGVLRGFDAAVEGIIGEWEQAEGRAVRSAAGRRAAVAIAIHDSVIASVLCQLLETAPGGAPVADRLRDGCRERAGLQVRYDEHIRRSRPGAAPPIGSRTGADHDTGGESDEGTDEVVARLVRSFAGHEREGTDEVESHLSGLPDDAFRTWVSPLNDVMWPWRSGGPALLALRMATWAESCPTRSHAALLRHPSSRMLRGYYRMVDRFRDYWGESAVERWVVPRLPTRPFADGPPATGASTTEPEPR